MNAPLLDQHKQIVANSAISPEVAAAREYRTITTKAEARRLGFSDAQCNVPALLIPIWGVTGQIATYQLRPDTPRVKDGKPLKYETPAGSQMALDVPRGIRNMLGDPGIPLIITEGARKADSAVSQGLCCVALLGVWNWRGRNEFDGKTALPDWEHVALNGRPVRIAFDSDVMEKVTVYAALVRLCGFLRRRGAQVEMIYLPAGPGGAKVGLDDFFAAGNIPADLWRYATPQLREPPRDADVFTGPYIVRDNRIVFLRRVGENATEPVFLTNFSATIVEEVIADDGATERGELVIAGTLADGSPLPAVRVPHAQFAAMNWPIGQWGYRAVVAAGIGAKDRAREAIQLLSPDVARRREYAHSGWRQIEGQWAYLHAGGAIGASGEVDSVTVQLGGSLGRLLLPLPADADVRRDAVRASLSILDSAPDRITAAMLGAVYRAPLNHLRGADMAVHLAGSTGVRKTELAVLAMQHYGAGFDRLHLPASWISTPNFLERIAFEAKDALLIIDDFAPQGSQQDINRLHALADRVIRGAGNGASRGRMAADGRLRPDYPPRALVIGTGEDVPRGQSLRARMAILEIGPGEVDLAALTIAQRHGASGLLARATAGYIMWLASRLDELAVTVGDDLARLRTAARQHDAHARTPDIVANLAYGWQTFLDFALECDAITEEEHTLLWRRCWRALGEMAAAQGDHQRAEDPTRRFLDLIAAAVSSWEAHLADMDGLAPESAESWGWKMVGRESRDETGISDAEPLYYPQGRRIGWIDGDDLYLQPDAAYSAAQKMATTNGSPLGIAPGTLAKRLHERQLLRSVEQSRNGYAVRRTIEGQRRPVLHLSSASLLAAERDQRDHRDPEPSAPLSYKAGMAGVGHNDGHNPPGDDVERDRESDHRDSNGRAGGHGGHIGHETGTPIHDRNVQGHRTITECDIRFLFPEKAAGDD